MDLIISIIGDGLNRKHEIFDFMRGNKKKKYRNNQQEDLINEDQPLKGYCAINMALLNQNIKNKSCKILVKLASNLIMNELDEYNQILMELTDMVLIVFDSGKIIEPQDITKSIMNNKAINIHRKHSGIVLVNPIEQGLFENLDEYLAFEEEILKFSAQQLGNSIKFIKLVELNPFENPIDSGLQERVLFTKSGFIKELLNEKKLQQTKKHAK